MNFSTPSTSDDDDDDDDLTSYQVLSSGPSSHSSMASVVATGAPAPASAIPAASIDNHGTRSILHYTLVELLRQTDDMASMMVAQRERIVDVLGKFAYDDVAGGGGGGDGGVDDE